MKKIILFVSLLLFLGAALQAKQYGLEKAQVYYAIRADGSIAVTCDLSYWFSGSFSTAWITLPMKDFIVTRPEVSELSGQEEIPYRFQRETPEMTPSTFDFTHDGRQYRLAWFYRATDTKKTFRLRYEILKGLKVYEDVAEFYFKVWGADWEINLPALWVEVSLPSLIKAKEEVNYWLHPKIEGQIGISKDFQKIIAYAGNIPARQWVEVRVIFPRSYLASLNPANVFLVEGPGREKVLQEEQSWQTKEAKKQKILKFLEALALPLAAAFLLMGIIIPLRTYFRYGREPKVAYQLDYEREVPEGISPAQADMLLSQAKQVSPRAIVASTLELARLGFLRIEEVEREGFFGKKIKDYKIVLREKEPPEELTPELKLFLAKWRELAGKSGILLSDLKKRDLSGFKTSFDKQVKKIVYGKNGWINSQGEKILWRWTIIWIGLVVFSFVTLFLFASPPESLPEARTLFLPMAALFINIFLGLFFLKAVRQYKPEGKLLSLRLKALRQFLKDFSLLAQYPPESIVIWEKYLVFGTVLGVAKEVLRAMKELQIPLDSITWMSPAIVSKGDFAAAFESFNSSLNSFSQAFASAVAASTRSSSSAGGGRGVGGGGGGAR